jgi:O-antigen ligase
MYLVGITAYLSIFISATRTLFALFTIIFMGVFSKTIKDAIRWAMMVLLIVLLMFALIKFEVISMDYLKYSAWGRVSQLAMFFEGRGGEIDTFGERLGTLEVLKEKISQSMILGYGFSTTSLTCVDNDWGAANTILVLGLVGLLLYILLFVSYFKMILSALGKTRRENRELLRVLLVSFIGMLGIYCFTWDFFTPLSDRKIAFMMVFFGISEILSGSADQSN